MAYEKLKVEAFGRSLINSGDLDPVYIALAGVDWNEEQLQRWLMAYWCFYHPGAASYIADATSEELFWNRMSNAAKNESPSPLDGRWPRASERRHFRGEAAVKAVHQLRVTPLADAFAAFNRAAPSYPALAKEVQTLPLFGPWIAFKVADMLERCCGVPVDFDLGSVTMFDDPRKAALMVARHNLGMPAEAKFKDPEGVIRRVVEHLIAEYADLAAPPARDRAVGYQEVETVLCKWKSHVNGHYPLGKDTREIAEGLHAWASVSESAREFLCHMPADASANGDSPEAPAEDKVTA